MFTTRKIRFALWCKVLATLKKWHSVQLAWQHNYRSRKQLAEMSEHQLKDIGFTRCEQRYEAQKPFWQR